MVQVVERVVVGVGQNLEVALGVTRIVSVALHLAVEETGVRLQRAEPWPAVVACAFADMVGRALELVGRGSHLLQLFPLRVTARPSGAMVPVFPRGGNTRGRSHVAEGASHLSRQRDTDDWQSHG